MRAAGLDVRHDEVGNLRAAAHRRGALGVGEPVVMTGSHLDSVPSGGTARRAARRRRRAVRRSRRSTPPACRRGGRSRWWCSSARRARAFAAARSDRRRCRGMSRSRACWRWSIPTASSIATRSPPMATRARRIAAAQARSGRDRTRSSSCTSSRAACSRRASADRRGHRASPAWCSAPSSSSATPTTPARRRWICATTRCWPRRSGRSRIERAARELGGGAVGTVGKLTV